MTPTSNSWRDHLGLLVALDRRRVRGLVRRPTATLVVAFTLPVVAVVSGLWTVGRFAASGVEGLSDGVTLGLLASAAVSFIAYGVLFGAADDGFLRRLGVDPQALFVERSIRLTGAGCATAVALTIPFMASRDPLLAPFAVALGAASAAVAGGALTLAWAARALATGRAGYLSTGIQFDKDLARTAPLIYAPLPPFLLGAAFGAITGAWVVAATLSVLALGVPVILLASRVFATAAPRFFPYAREISYSPPPERGETFRVGRGLSALMPAGAAATGVRDATVASRRFPWAARIAWPVGIVAIAALARWGTSPATHAWVVIAVGTTLCVQGAAIVAIGRLERDGRRWVDRSLGVRDWERFLGRWTWGWGLTLWLLVPVALAWRWWSGMGGAWIWPLGGAIVALIATATSLLQAGRR